MSSGAARADVNRSSTLTSPAETPMELPPPLELAALALAAPFLCRSADMLQRLSHKIADATTVVGERLHLLYGAIDLRRFVAEVGERASQIVEGAGGPAPC